MVGWTLLQLFDEEQGLIQQKWVCPIFKPPTQFSSVPNQLINKLELVKSSKLFVRIAHPRNANLNQLLKKDDILDQSYLASPFHDQVFRPPKFYSEWKKQVAKNRDKALELAKEVEGDVQLIKRYLDDEDEYIKRELDRE